ncbi:MAG: hypothetical protein ACXVJD_03365, partial [Mucilaginibacter sp.]
MHRGGFFKVFLIIAAISLLLDWYVYNGLKTFTQDWQSERLRQLVKWGYLVISVGVTLLFVGGFGSFSTAKGMTPFHEWMLSLFLTFFITKIFFVFVLFLGDVGRFFYGIAEHVGKPEGKVIEPFFPARRKFIAEAAILVAVVPFAGFFYAMFRGKYDYKVHRETLYFTDLPDAFDGFTITQ